VIRVRVRAPSAVVQAGLEALMASSPAISLTDSLPDVVLSAIPLEELSSAPAIVLLADESPASWTQEALRMGVRAVLPRDASAAEILAAVEAAAAGMVVIDPRELESLLAASPVPAQTSGETPPLTARELEVLRMMADGAANKTIAWKLNISEHTAKFHVASILSKLNASTRTEAVTIGIRKALILI
jgi:DNA-binding NarL/FixJ family response regulator